MIKAKARQVLPGRHRTELSERLAERRPEMEQAMLARVYAVSDPGEVDDPDYAVGLREAVAAGLDYAIAGIETGEDRRPPAPTQILAQARAAARNGVSLDTVLRRYFAGYSLLSDFVVQEAERSGVLHTAELQNLLRSVSALFDGLVATAAREYSEEADVRLRSAEQRRAQKVRRLLAGELLDTLELGYEIDAWHVAAIGSGQGAADAIRELAGALDRSLLMVPSEEKTVWVWLGGVHRLAVPELLRAVDSTRWPEGTLLALGEPGRGIDGWRSTHRQASAAMSVAQHGADKVVRYVDVALLSSVLHDEILAAALHENYLAPLAEERDGGKALRKTLTTYFAAGRHISSTAAAMGVSRQTVSNRLHVVEQRIGRPLESCAAEMETALRLQELGKGQAR
jgi:hypothetical protein